MPFERPDLAAIQAAIKADLAAHLPDSDPELRRGNLSVLARVLAGAVHGVYGYAEFMAGQILPDSAEASYLERHASLWGIYRKPATAASGRAAFTGTSGSIIPAGAEVKRTDGTRYVVMEAVELVNGSALATLRAQVAGSAGNADVNTGVTLLTYVNGVKTTGKVAAGGLGGGADRETDADLRARVLARIQEPPQGGSRTDYLAWALAVPGVTRAWVDPSRMGAGTVGVFIVTDDHPDGPIPGQADVEAVQAYIDARRPVCARPTVIGPIAQPLDFHIYLKVSDDLAIRQAVQTSLAALFRRESEPEGTLLISHIREAVSTAAGEYDHELISPTGDITAAAGCLLTLGEIDWSME